MQALAPLTFDTGDQLFLDHGEMLRNRVKCNLVEKRRIATSCADWI